MIVRALDTNNDWTFGAGKSNYKSGNAAVAQNIQTRLMSFLGDCFFSIGAGIDWFTFLGGSKSQLALNLAISSTILNTANVTGLKQMNLSLDPKTRNFFITYRVQTIYGVVTNAFQYDINGMVA